MKNHIKTVTDMAVRVLDKHLGDAIHEDVWVAGFVAGDANEIIIHVGDTSLKYVMVEETPAIKMEGI